MYSTELALEREDVDECCVVERKTITPKVLLLIGCLFVAKQVDTYTHTQEMNGKFGQDNALSLLLPLRTSDSKVMTARMAAPSLWWIAVAAVTALMCCCTRDRDSHKPSYTSSIHTWTHR